jgi:hypothetical protein
LLPINYTIMSELNQKRLLVFGGVMVAMIALLLALQLGFGSLAGAEPQMINLRSMLVSALIAAALTMTVGPHESSRP